MRLLLQDKIIGIKKKREYIQDLFIFIDNIITLSDEDDNKLIQEFMPIIEKEESNMGLSLEDTSFARYYRKEGFEKGKLEGKMEIAKNLLNINMDIEEICRLTGLSADEIKKLKDKN